MLSIEIEITSNALLCLIRRGTLETSTTQDSNFFSDWKEYKDNIRNSLPEIIKLE